MSKLTCTRHRLTIKLVTIKRQHPGQIFKIRITEPEPGPVQIENAAGPLPDSGRNRLPGTKGQSASALGM
jgi:hypothetical protein